MECASPLALWNAAMANPDVAADVSPLIIPAGGKFEPTHVGCYDEIDERPARQSGLLSGR